MFKIFDQILSNNANYSVLFRLLLAGDCCTRSALAAQSGLSKMTVSNIVAFFIENNLIVEEKDTLSERRGRPVTRLALSPLAPKVISVTIDQETIVFSLLSLSGERLFSSSQAIVPENSLRSENISSGIDAVLRKSINEKIAGIIILCAGYFSDDSPLDTSALQEQYGLEVHRESLITYSALSELYFGNGRDTDDLIYVEIGKEISSTAIINRKILENSRKIGMNLGHVSIDYNGLSCSCGNRGCLQSYISTEAMEKKLRDITKLKADFKGFCEMQSKKNDARVDWAFKDMMDKLGFALKSVSNIIGPSNVVIGGLGSLIPERYLAKLEKALSTEDRPIKVFKVTPKEEKRDTLIASFLLQQLETI